MRAKLEFGLPAGLPLDLYEQVVRELPGLGYDGLWLNDTDIGDGLIALSAVADSGLRLGVERGVAESGPGRDVGEIGHLEAVRSGRAEGAVHETGRMR